MKYFYQALEGGCTKAYHLLGLAYTDSKGVKQDVNKGTEYFLKAAKTEDKRSYFRLGDAYFEGKGKSSG